MKASILVVEDDFIIGEDIKASLEELGFRVPHVASTAREALGAAASQAPDLVLADIVLQGRKDGILAARQIRRSLGTPVIFLTAYGDDHTLELAKQADPAAFLLKPFRPRELNACIEVALHHPRPEPLQEPASTGLGGPASSYRPAAVAGTPLTMCAWCKRIRGTPDEWLSCERYLRDVLGLDCTHGMCPSCFAKTSQE